MKKGNRQQKTNPAFVSLLKQKRLNLLDTLKEKSTHNIYKVTSQENRKTFSLKIAKDRHATLALRNHYFGTKQVVPKLPPSASFVIPKIVDCGFVDKQYFWILSDYIEGESFAKTDGVVAKINVENPEKYLKKIVELTIFLQKLDTQSLRGIDNRFGRNIKTTKLALLESAISNARNNTPFLAELLQIISANYKDLASTTNHCDLTPINLLITNDGKIALIDADLGNILRFRYYDVAEFYNRLNTRVCRPDLAKTFLALFIQKLRKNQIQKFLNNFLCLSALRAISNFVEIESIEKAKRAKRLKMAKAFVQDVINYKIIEV